MLLVLDKLFREISEAYQCLTNRTEKRRYESSRKPKRTEVAAVKKEEPTQRETAGRPSPVPEEQDTGIWHRYNRFQSGYHVYYYTKDKTNRTKGGEASPVTDPKIFSARLLKGVRPKKTFSTCTRR